LSATADFLVLSFYESTIDSTAVVGLTLLSASQPRMIVASPVSLQEFALSVFRYRILTQAAESIRCFLFINICVNQVRYIRI